MKVTLNPTRLTAGKEKGEKRKTHSGVLHLAPSRRGQALSLGFHHENIPPKEHRCRLIRTCFKMTLGLMDGGCEVSGGANLQRSAKKIKKNLQITQSRRCTPKRLQLHGGAPSNELD